MEDGAGRLSLSAILNSPSSLPHHSDPPYSGERSNYQNGSSEGENPNTEARNSKQCSSLVPKLHLGTKDCGSCTALLATPRAFPSTTWERGAEDSEDRG